MLAQLIRNNSDRYLREVEVNLKDYLDRPFVGHKDDVPLWQFIKTKSDKTRDQTNYVSIHALIIEFDKGIRIDEFESKYTHLRWVLHTTSNHTRDDHRFRVIVPLDCEYPYIFFKNRNVRTALIEYFEGIDRSCFSNFQKIPAMCPNQDDYYYKVNKGEPFNFEILRQRIWELDMEDWGRNCIRATQCQSMPAQTSLKGFEAYKRAAEVDIVSRYSGCGANRSGSRYTDLTSMAGTLINAKYSRSNINLFEDWEVERLVYNEYRDHAIEKMVNDLLDRR